MCLDLLQYSNCHNQILDNHHYLWAHLRNNLDPRCLHCHCFPVPATLVHLTVDQLHFAVIAFVILQQNLKKKHKIFNFYPRVQTSKLFNPSIKWKIVTVHCILPFINCIRPDLLVLQILDFSCKVKSNSAWNIKLTDTKGLITIYCLRHQWPYSFLSIETSFDKAHYYVCFYKYIQQKTKKNNSFKIWTNVSFTSVISLIYFQSVIFYYINIRDKNNIRKFMKPRLMRLLSFRGWKILLPTTLF